MTYMAIIASGVVLGGGISFALDGMRRRDIQAEGLGLIVCALSAIAWAIIGLTKG